MRRRATVICLSLCVMAGLGYWIFLRYFAVPWALSAQMRRGPGATVDFTEVAPFAWERIHFFAPYTPHDQIHGSLGFAWEGVERTTIHWNEGVNLVVFVRGAKVVYWFEHTRHEELAELAGPHGYPREQARFTVYVATEGRLALAPPNN
jgi:hypothetical protein